ncbi:hypothetical protein AK812_SmicGene13093 [Symbiodinium microadriaticum]|uniref:Uncharacterized protein n=1 Tax=Symbiodinium microadriaticum TaxID=2951 RepID=A0A1Q9E919_SYMMI|nr:hypothetical protein AK812_SmicGene13093 [Symbiodinium microadriaticum]
MGLSKRIHLGGQLFPELYCRDFEFYRKVLILPSDEMPSSPSDVAAVTSSLRKTVAQGPNTSLKDTKPCDPEGSLRSPPRFHLWKGGAKVGAYLFEFANADYLSWGQAAPQKCFGLLQFMAEVSHLGWGGGWPRFLMEVVATILARAGAGTRILQRHEQAQVTRQCLRAALLRSKELLERFLEQRDELIEALRPTAETLEFLFNRLASSGAIQTSAVVVLAQHFPSSCRVFFVCRPLRRPEEEEEQEQEKEPEQEQEQVKATIGETGKAGDVVPIVAEIILRLCRGSVLDLNTEKKARRRYADVKRELRRKRRLQGDEESSGSADEDEVAFSKDQQEVNVLLASMSGSEKSRRDCRTVHELVQNRLQLKGDTLQKGPALVARALEGRVPRFAATPTELEVLASVAERGGAPIRPWLSNWWPT